MSKENPVPREDICQNCAAYHMFLWAINGTIGYCWNSESDHYAHLLDCCHPKCKQVEKYDTPDEKGRSRFHRTFGRSGAERAD